MIPVVSKTYDNQKKYGNLFLFISAPAGSGKSVIQFAKKIGQKTHNSILDKSNKAREEYKLAMIRYKQLPNAEKATAEIPNEPLLKMLFLPANNSASGANELLSNNDGQGIIFETEGDTLTQAFLQDWGNYSDSFRKAFQNEEISYYRRTNKEHVNVREPKLSTVLSGTPNQIINLIQTKENGLFSRFMYYHVDIVPVMQNVFAKNDYTFDQDFNSFAEVLYQLYCKQTESDYSIHFNLTQYQMTKLFEIFEKWHDKWYFLFGADMLASIRRLGLMTFKLCMVLTIIRNIEFLLKSNQIKHVLECDDIDFKTSVSIVTCLSLHTLDIANLLPHEESSFQKNVSNTKKEFYEVLPTEFKREDGLKLALEHKISRSTFGRMLKSSMFVRVDGKFGYYRKNE